MTQSVVSSPSRRHLPSTFQRTPDHLIASYSSGRFLFLRESKRRQHILGTHRPITWNRLKNDPTYQHSGRYPRGFTLPQPTSKSPSSPYSSPRQILIHNTYGMIFSSPASPKHYIFTVSSTHFPRPLLRCGFLLVFNHSTIPDSLKDSRLLLQP